MTSSGRSLWTWILTARSSPATSTDSPIRSSRARIAATSSRCPLGGRTHEDRLVAVALVASSATQVPAGRCRAAASRRAAACSPTHATASAPRSSSSRPSPPASTTPASRSTGSSDGRARDRRRRLVDRRGSTCSSVRRARRPCRSLGRVAGDGQDRALDRLGDRREGRLAAALEGSARSSADDALACPRRPRPCRGRAATGSRRCCRARPSARPG